MPVATRIACTERGALLVVPIRTACGTAVRIAVRIAIWIRTARGTAVRITVRIAIWIIIVIVTEIGALVIITGSSCWIDLQYTPDVIHERTLK